jgi:hypothetical protein
MNPNLVLQFMAQDLPWAFGLRHAIAEGPHMLATAPLHEAPFFAVIGPYGNQFRVLGDDLEECLQKCLDHKFETIQPPPA